MNAFIDFVVQQIYAEARRDPSRATPTPELAQALVGPDSIRRVSTRQLEKPAAASEASGRLVIHVPQTVAPWQANHLVGRQLARWYLIHHGYDGGHVDSVVRCLAAALCLPTPAFWRARDALGEGLADLGAHFRVSQSLAALRVAECAGYPTALKTEKKILVRGNHWDWPVTQEEWGGLFRHARERGMVLTPLSDARGRIVLRSR